VHFFGEHSHSNHGKITSYEWDFGDGDLSSRKNPVNTYFSTTYGSKYFTATLTVKDEKGNSATSSVAVEVMTR
jgi:microbial collagenase